MAQLELIPWLNPLDARLGRAWFAEVAEAPGVYLFLRRDAQVLYVGQSACLRQRLNSYRHIHPRSASRRHCRLVVQTFTIRVHLCPSPRLAAYLERILIRRYRPTFNRAGNGNPPAGKGEGQMRLWADGVEPSTAPAQPRR